LIEPYLKLPEAISREMAVIILQTSLKTFLTNYNFQVRFSHICLVTASLHRFCKKY
jgi:hypothetical protein